MNIEAPLKLVLNGILDDDSIKKLNEHYKAGGLFSVSSFSCKKGYSDKTYSTIIEIIAINSISKPLPTRTKFEYVRVEDSIFHPELQSDFESELLFFSNDDENFFAFTGDERTLIRCLLEYSLYRRIETPITDREEFIERAGDILPEFDKRTNPMWAGKLYDAGCRFVGE